MITASASTIGQKYKTSNGILVEVIEKRQSDVVVKSYETGHNVLVPLTYQLTHVVETDIVIQPIPVKVDVEEKAMSNDTAAVTEAPKARKVKKSNIVDEGLKAGLSVEEITKNVLTTFPETLEKSVRNLVSVRRSKLKKTV